MTRQLVLWKDDTPATDLKSAAPESERVSTELATTSAAEFTRDSVQPLFTNPDRQSILENTDAQNETEITVHDTVISINRTRKDIDGPPHRFAIKLDDFVEVFVGAGAFDYGRVVAISPSRSEVRVEFDGHRESDWFDVQGIYPTASIGRESLSGNRNHDTSSPQAEETGSAPWSVAERIAEEAQYTSVKIVSLVRIGDLVGRARITSAADSCRFFAKYWQEYPGQDQERFIVACLDTKNRIQCVVPITVGTLDASLVHPREVFKPAIIEGSSAILLSHNHPSGDPTPSKEDHGVTKRLTEAGELLGITVLDHIVHGDGSGKVVSVREV